MFIRKKTCRYCCPIRTSNRFDQTNVPNIFEKIRFQKIRSSIRSVYITNHLFFGRSYPMTFSSSLRCSVIMTLSDRLTTNVLSTICTCLCNRIFAVILRVNCLQQMWVWHTVVNRIECRQQMDPEMRIEYNEMIFSKSSSVVARAALRLVRAQMMCQMRAQGFR